MGMCVFLGNGPINIREKYTSPTNIYQATQTIVQIHVPVRLDLQLTLMACAQFSQKFCSLVTGHLLVHACGQ